MPDNKPWWYPVPIGDPPEGMADRHKYVATAKWDHLLDAERDYEGLADAYLALEAVYEGLLAAIGGPVYRRDIEAEVEKLRAVAAAAKGLIANAPDVLMWEGALRLQQALRDAGIMEE